MDIMFLLMMVHSIYDIYNINELYRCALYMVAIIRMSFH